MDVEKLLGLHLCLPTLLPHKTTFLWVTRPRDGSARGLGAEGRAPGCKGKPRVQVAVQGRPGV